MSLFKNKKSGDLESIHNQNIEEKEQKEVRFHNETKDFVQDISKLLGDTVKQHHIVDTEHDVLGELASKISIHMDEIPDLT